MKKYDVKINTSTEKAILALSASVALAILFDGKKKKPHKRKGFVKRVAGNYRTVDRALTSIAAKSIKEQKLKDIRNSYCEKLRDLEIQGSEPIDVEFLTEKK